MKPCYIVQAGIELMILMPQSLNIGIADIYLTMNLLLVYSEEMLERNN
jgi:hypothetical protein